MESLFEFIFGLGIAIFPAIIFFSWYFHKNGTEMRDDMERKFHKAVIDLNRAKATVIQLKRKISKIETQHIEFEKKTEQLQNNIDAIGEKYLRDTLRAIELKVTPNNLNTSKRQMEKAIELVQNNGFELVDEDIQEFMATIELAHSDAVKKENARVDRKKGKVRMRDKKRAARERDQQIKRLEKEMAVIESALEKSLKEQIDHHKGEIEWLTKQLDEVKMKLKRAKSLETLDNAGHIYVVSNIGSFGEGVYMVGMTQRVEPMDAIRDMNDEAVPFPFDVHMIIHSDDAPALELAIQKELEANRLNRVDMGKAFFNTDLKSIRDAIKKHHGDVTYQALAEAFEYRESQSLAKRQGEILWHARKDDFQDAA